jgi:hypothetical protein
MNRQKRKRKRADFKAGDLVTWAPHTTDVQRMTGFKNSPGTKAVIKEVIHFASDKLGMGSILVLLWLDGSNDHNRFPASRFIHLTTT